MDPKYLLQNWLSHHNHEGKRDKPICAMDIKVDTMQSMTHVLECMSISQIQQATVQDEHLQCLKNIIISGWPTTKDQLHIDIRPYWSYKDDLAVIDSIVMKGRHIIIPQRAKAAGTGPPPCNHMAISKTKLLACKSVYWVNINNDIESLVKNCSTCLEFQQTQPKEKTIHHDIPIRPWDVIGADVFQLNNKKLFMHC